MKKFLATAVISAALVLVAVSAASAEDSTRSANRRNVESALNQAKAASRSAEQLSKFKESANKLIDERLDSLSKEIARINSTKRLTSDDKTGLVADLNSAITGLTNLKAKISSDTTADAAKADIKSIFEGYRVYAVLEPKIEGLMMVAKLNYQIDRLSASAVKISSLITKVQNSGKDTTAMKALLTDYQAKIADAKTQVANAKAKFQAMKVSDVAGSRALFQDGKELLKAAKTDVIAAHKDLQSIIPLVRTALGFKEASGSAKPATGSGTTSTASATH